MILFRNIFLYIMNGKKINAANCRTATEWDDIESVKLLFLFHAAREMSFLREEKGESDQALWG